MVDGLVFSAREFAGLLHFLLFDLLLALVACSFALAGRSCGCPTLRRFANLEGIGQRAKIQRRAPGGCRSRACCVPFEPRFELTPIQPVLRNERVVIVKHRESFHNASHLKYVGRCIRTIYPRSYGLLQACCVGAYNNPFDNPAVPRIELGVQKHFTSIIGVLERPIYRVATGFTILQDCFMRERCSCRCRGLTSKTTKSQRTFLTCPA